MLLGNCHDAAMVTQISAVCLDVIKVNQGKYNRFYSTADSQMSSPTQVMIALLIDPFLPNIILFSSTQSARQRIQLRIASEWYDINKMDYSHLR